MNPNVHNLTELAIDIHLANVWEMLAQLHLDEEALALVATTNRAAYVRGYHDGDKLDPVEIQGYDFDDEDIDIRLADVWLELVAADVLRSAYRNIVTAMLRCAYCRGFLDGSDTKPFGPAPADRPDTLLLPA